MCFTVNVNLVKEELQSRFGTELLDPEKYNPSYYYHAFAYPDLPLAYNNEKGERELRTMKWGLIPSWIDSAEEADKIRRMTPNARSETASSKPSFSDSLENRRCIIPVNGFYEWQHHPSGKRPWYIYRKDHQILLLAGIFDIWQIPYNEVEMSNSGAEDNSLIASFSVLTTRSNLLMSEIHNSKKRMPVIIQNSMVENWINEGHNYQEELFQPIDDAYLEAHTVNPAIGKKSFEKNRPESIKEYKFPEELTLF